MEDLPVKAPIHVRVNQEPGEDAVTLGQWYWVAVSAEPGEAPERLLSCVTSLASNHAVLTSPVDTQSSRTFRIRYEEFGGEEVAFEPAAQAVITGRIADLQQESARLIGEVAALMARLGMSPNAPALTGGASSAPGNALMVMSAAPDVASYKRDLMAAKEEVLPDLFKQIEAVNRKLTAWMTAPTLALAAQVSPLKERIGEIENRIFSVELYAGLTERVHQVADGAPAALDEKLHVMQRQIYMDEECLANYSDGGMDIRDLGTFNVWLARPENRDRLLPWPRTLVTMRVRRHVKKREHGGNLGQLMTNAALSEADKRTFLYLRNGEQVWSLSCDLDFGEMLFPDDETSSLASGPLMVRKDGHGWWHRPHEKLMPVALFEQLSAEHADWRARADVWLAENPDAKWIDQPGWIHHGGPRHQHDGFRPTNWEPLTPDSLEYDQAMAAVGQEIASYNRVCLIIQGLFDRSPVLHPHNPARLWDAAGFADALTLVYDKTRALYAGGEAPDFEAYRQRCNAEMKAGAVVAGVEELWLRREAERENARLDVDWRRTEHRHTHLRPYGDPGPGLVATIDRWSPRSGQGTVRWVRESRSFRSDRGAIPASLRFAADTVLNVSAYRPGDYRQFFSDPRTREQYLKWAPLLMAAEDWHAGRLTERPDMPGAWDGRRCR